MNNSAELLKLATRKKKDNDLEGAISCLRQAYNAIAVADERDSVKTFLRLPAYLELAGKNDAAWVEFNDILVGEYPVLGIEDPVMYPMPSSKVYEKMASFLYRTGKRQQSIQYDILAYLSWGHGLTLQDRNKEFIEYTSETTIRNCVAGWLEELGKDRFADEVVRVIKDHFSNGRDMSIHDAVNAINATIFD